MTIGQPKTRTLPCCLRGFVCTVLGCSLLYSIFIVKSSQRSTCVPGNPDDAFINRQDEWQYQNSITGEWYYWRSIYKKQYNDTLWRVKWLNTAPRSLLGVIVYLTGRDELESLNQSLSQLSRLLSNKPRPVVIFHEGDLDDNDTQQSLAKIVGDQTPLGFECIKFFNSSKAPWLLPRVSASKYFDKCRFFTLMLPNHPLLTLFSFYWRLDANSYIFAPKPIEDPFEIMRDRQIQYAFVMADVDNDVYTDEIWGLFLKFTSRSCLNLSPVLRQTQTGWFGEYSHAIFSTNSGIVNSSLFGDHPLIRAWLQTVDRDGGIYRYRWCDAPIHTLAVTQFVPHMQILRLSYFGYMHRPEYVCASGVERDLCKEYVNRFLTFKVTHDSYDDGCAPGARNALCRFFPKVIP